MDPAYRPSLMQKNGGSSVLPFAGSDLVLSPAQWSSHVVGKNYYRLFCCVTFSKFVVLCVGLFECPSELILTVSIRFIYFTFIQVIFCWQLNVLVFIPFTYHYIFP